MITCQLHLPCLAGDITDQCFRIAEMIIPEAEAEPFRPGIDTGDIGLPAENLDLDGIDEVAHFFGNRTETVDHFRHKAIHICHGIDGGNAAIKRQPHSQISNIGIGINTAVPRLITGDHV